MNARRSRRLALAALLIAAACSKEEPAASGGAQAPPAAPDKPAPADPGPIDPATTATITGVVRYQGAPPARAPISMTADATCHAAHPSPALAEDLVVNPDGTLRNVLVHVKTGLEGRTFPVPLDAVEIDQHGCTYIPHVLVLQAGQSWRIKNSDPTLHNIHTLPAKNTQFNQGMTEGSPDLTKSFKNPELGIRVKCDVHPWMGAVVHVLKHPFFAITGEGGTFTISGLPPGEYTLEGLHEKLGSKTATLKLAAHGKETIEIVFP